MVTADFTNVMKHKTDYFSKEEIAAILNYCNSVYNYYKQVGMRHLTDKWLRNYCLFMTLYRTGRRISEVVGQKPYKSTPGLRPMDFYTDNLIEFTILKKNQIRTKTKGNKDIAEEKLIKMRWEKEHKRVLIPVDTEYYNLMKMLIKHNNIQPHQRIFKFSRQRADKILKKITNNIGIYRPQKKIHCHMFRHTFAVHFLKGNPNNPMALIQLKDLLHHSNIDITTTYTQFTPEDKVGSLEKAFGDTTR
jgi:site-specific recombinase XerD